MMILKKAMTFSNRNQYPLDDNGKIENVQNAGVNK
jgi:hypothetical protein